MAAVDNLNGRALLVAVIYAAWTTMVLGCLKVYRTTRVHHAGREGGYSVLSTALALLTAGAALYLFSMEDFSRGVLGLYYITSSAALVGKRVVLRWLLRRARASGYNLKHMLVVGDSTLAQRYIDSVEAERSLGIEVDEHLIPDENLEAKLEERLHGNGIDEVIVALGPNELQATASIIRMCEKCGTKISVIPFYNDVIPTRPTVDVVGSIKLIQLRTTPLDEPMNAFFKRSFDILVSIALLVLLSPLFAIIAIAIRLSSPGPVLFRQERVGLNKKTFYMLKFRSMRVNDTQDTAWSTRQDDRRTKIGSILRKTSLDELPQLWNVLKGQMSLVGPRPLTIQYLPYYSEEERHRHDVRPGLSGLAQVNGRNFIDWDHRLAFDVQYVKKITFIGDLRIILQTALKFVKKEDIAVDTNKVEPNFAEERRLKMQVK